MTARREERLKQLASELGSVAVAGDIASAAHRQALAAAVADRFGRLDILINNAGVCDDGPQEDQTLSELETVIQVNLVAVLDLCRLVAPLLFASDHASVINIASIYGLVASRGPMAAYNSTKDGAGRPYPSSRRPVGTAAGARQRARPRVFPLGADRNAG